MISSRVKKLQSSLEHPLLIKKKENLLYLTGRLFMHGYLLVNPIHPLRSTLYPNVIFFGDGLEKIEGVKIDRLKNLPLYLGKAKALDLEEEFTFAEYNYIRQKIKDLRLKIKLNHVKSPVDFQRAVKDSGEIRLIGKSMKIVERVFGLVRKEIKKPGMTEVRLAGFIKQAGLKLGAEDVSFPPIAASGANAAVPHHVPSKKLLKVGEPIILDFGFKYKGYCSDFTRTLFLKKIPARLEQAYNQVEKAYWEAIKHIGSSQASSITHNARSKTTRVARPQDAIRIIAGDVYQKAVDVLAEKQLEKYFIHSLGHGTGLEIHELPNLSPRSKDKLENGMVFSIEPGVYIPRLGGIRVEDLVYLEKGQIKRFIAVSTKLSDNIIK